jgi:hypothetical protein
MDETDHGLTPRIEQFESEQESQWNQRSSNTTPAPVLALRTASYCTENEGTPNHPPLHGRLRPDWSIIEGFQIGLGTHQEQTNTVRGERHTGGS